MVKHFIDTSQADEQDEVPRIAVVGRPNVGKSSLINTFTGEERNIVTPLAGTTRDAIDTHYRKFGYDFIFVDTAGLRRKTRVKEDLEFYSVMRSIRAIESSDVACYWLMPLRD
jgi:GTP-binding protein